MERPCANGACTANGTKRCSQCRESSYCSQLCQKADWPTHKLTCTQPPVNTTNQGLIQCVQIYSLGDGGGRYEAASLPPYHNVFSTLPLPITQKFGIPLVMWRLNTKLPRRQPTDNQHATWLMIDPVSGFAPPEWQGGIGNVYVARADRTTLTVETLAAVTDWVSRILDAFGDMDPGAVARLYYDKGKFERYLERHRKEQEEYGAALRDLQT